MYLSKVIKVILLLSLLALVVPAAIARGQTAGTAIIRDSSPTLSDQIVIELADLPALAADEVYEGWLVTDDGSEKLSLGILNVGAGGSVSQTYTSPLGVNLTSIYDKFVVTIEPVPDPDPGPSSLVAASDQILPGGMVHIRHLLYSWTGNPEYSSGIYSSSGLLIRLNEENNSGQSGWAALSEKGSDLEVILWITSGTLDTDLVHIHSGQCGPTLGGVVHSLTNFSSGAGTSTTLLPGVSLDGLLTGDFAINSHSTADASVYTTCGNIPTSTQGIPKGITVGLWEQTNVALIHAGLALDSSTLAGVKQHAEHVINAIEGSDGPNYGDLDGNGAVEDFGDGFGVLNYAVDARKHAEFTVQTVPGDTTFSTFEPQVSESSDNVGTWSGLARDMALDALNSGSTGAAQAFMANARTLLDRALNGYDTDRDGTVTLGGAEGGATQAQWGAQNMGRYDLGGAALPATGDINYTLFAVIALVAGAVLLSGGGLLFLRKRTQS